MDNLNSEIDNVKQALNISDLTAQVRERERDWDFVHVLCEFLFVCNTWTYTFDVTFFLAFNECMLIIW